MPWGLLLPLTISATALGSLFGALEVASVAFADDSGHKALSGLMLGTFSLGSLVAGVAAGAIIWQRGPLQRARIGLGILAVGTVSLPFLPGLLIVTIALFFDRPGTRAHADRAVLADRGHGALGHGSTRRWGSCRPG